MNVLRERQHSAVRKGELKEERRERRGKERGGVKEVEERGRKEERRRNEGRRG